MNVVVVGVHAGGLLAFRGDLLREMAELGHHVLALVPQSEDKPEVRAAIEEMGVGYATVPMRRNGMNPLRDLGTIRALRNAFSDFAADAVLVYAAKPVVYGSVAAWLAGVPKRAAMITGAGSALSGGTGLRRRIVATTLEMMYAVSLRRDHLVFFQNPDDERRFRSAHLFGPKQQVVRINGSGVDLERFRPVPLPDEPLSFLFIGRLIRDKGVLDFVDAARIVQAQHPDVRFRILGPLDSNPTAVRQATVDAWQREGIVEYLGETSDVRPFLADSHVLVLPSYGEGMPRSVLEAMAMARPVIVTDVPGCRETVRDGETGSLVRPRDIEDLAAAMVRMVERPEDLSAMGELGRLLAVDRFDVRAVNATILDAMGLAGSARGRSADTGASGPQTSTNRHPLDAYQHVPSTPIAEPAGEG